MKRGGDEEGGREKKGDGEHGKGNVKRNVFCLWRMSRPGSKRTQAWTNKVTPQLQPTDTVKFAGSLQVNGVAQTTGA